MDQNDPAKASSTFCIWEKKESGLELQNVRRSHLAYSFSNKYEPRQLNPWDNGEVC